MAWCALASPPRQPACWAVAAAAVPIAMQLSSLNTTGLSTFWAQHSRPDMQLWTCKRDWGWTRAGLGLVRSSEAVQAGGLLLAWRGVWWCLAPCGCKGGLCEQLLLRWLSSTGAAGSVPPRLVVSCSCGGTLYCMVWPSRTVWRAGTARAGAGTVWSAGAGVCSLPGAGDLP
jgi:hypothetical protein